MNWELAFASSRIEDKVLKRALFFGENVVYAAEIEKGIGAENEFIAHFKKYGNFDTLTRAMLVELVQEIRVFEDNKIEIDLKFRDAYKQVIEYIELNKEIARTA